jgi:hypothetical protein
MQSVAEHHPAADRFCVLVARDTQQTDSLRDEFTTIPIASLGLPGGDNFLFQHDSPALASVVQPWIFEHVFSRGYDTAVFIAPQILICQPLREAFCLLDTTADVVLTRCPDHALSFPTACLLSATRAPAPILRSAAVCPRATFRGSCPNCGGDIRLIAFRLLSECETIPGLRTLGNLRLLRTSCPRTRADPEDSDPPRRTAPTASAFTCPRHAPDSSSGKRSRKCH